MTVYNQKIMEIRESLFYDKKYTKWYFDIIDQALLSERSKLKRNNENYIYYESHHILPQAIFPQYKSFKKMPWNHVLLTAREHFVCHLLLPKMLKDPNHKRLMICGFIALGMSRKDQIRLTSRSFKYYREEYSKIVSERMSGRKVLKSTIEKYLKTMKSKYPDGKFRHKFEIKRGKEHPNFGKKLTKEQCDNISKFKRAFHKENPDFQKGENNPMFGKKASLETREKMSKSRIGSKNVWFGKVPPCINPENAKKVGEQLKQMIWVNDGNKNKRVKVQELDNFFLLFPNFTKGRLTPWQSKLVEGN